MTLLNPFVSFPAVGGGGYNPLTEFAWHSAFWADDPAWSNPGNGVEVSSWRNGGSLGTAATQGTSGNRPIFRSSTAAYNNKATVEFDTTNDDLTTGAFTAVAMPFSIVLVGNLASTSANANLFYLRSTDANPYTSGGRDTGGKFRLYSGTNHASTVDADTSPRLFVGRFAGGSATRFDVGATTTSGSSLSGDANAVYFNSNAGAGGFGGGHRAFFGLIAGDIFAHANYAALRSWAASYYGVSV